MNKRIRELSLQAGAQGLSNYDFINIDKFAELIVQECVEVCKGQATYDPIVLPYKPSEQFMSAIKKHFGVDQ